MKKAEKDKAEAEAAAAKAAKERDAAVTRAFEAGEAHEKARTTIAKLESEKAAQSKLLKAATTEKNDLKSKIADFNDESVTLAAKAASATKAKDAAEKIAREATAAAMLASDKLSAASATSAGFLNRACNAEDELKTTNSLLGQAQAEVKSLRLWKQSALRFEGLKGFMAGGGASSAAVAAAAAAGAGAADADADGDRDREQYLECDICFETSKTRETWHALGCPPPKSGSAAACRGYICEVCSKHKSVTKCPYCSSEHILPLAKRPLFRPIKKGA